MQFREPLLEFCEVLPLIDKDCRGQNVRHQRPAGNHAHTGHAGNGPARARVHDVPVAVAVNLHETFIVAAGGDGQVFQRYLANGPYVRKHTARMPDKNVIGGPVPRRFREAVDIAAQVNHAPGNAQPFQRRHRQVHRVPLGDTAHIQIHPGSRKLHGLVRVVKDYLVQPGLFFGRGQFRN